MKIVHALSLASIAFFVFLSARRFKLLNYSHYLQLLLASLLITVLYFIPLVYLLFKAFMIVQPYTPGAGSLHNGGWKYEMRHFANWGFMILKRSDLGTFGLFMSALIHLQIYTLLYVMMWCAYHVKNIS